MIIDALLLFDTASALTTSTNSVNTIDLVNARDMGIGDATGATPKIFCMVTTAFTTTNSATLQVLARGSTDNSTWTTYAESPAIAAASLTAGAKLLPIDWPHRGPGNALPRYLRLDYTVGTGVFSAGAITSALVLTRDDIPAYPSGFTVAN